MEKSSVPLPEPAMASGLPPHRLKQKLLKTALPFIVVIAVVIVGLLVAGSNKSKATPVTAHLLVDNTAQSQISLTSASGQPVYSVGYPKFSYLNFEAVSPKGELLLSSGITTSGESYLYVVSGKVKTLPLATTKALRSAIVLNSSHRLFFTDENDVIYVSCPTNAACQLNSLNLEDGQTKLIVNTGAKPVIAQLPPVYPLGLSTDRQTVYLRTLSGNRLGQSAAAVYAVNLNGRVIKSWDMPLNADYTPSLSPDASRVVYKAFGQKPSSAKITTLDIVTGKTFSADWSKGALADQPDVFSWSPDSKKVLFWGSDSILPRLKIDSTFDINLACLDVSSSKLSDLGTIKDSAHNMVGYHGWLDDNDIVYEQDSTTQAYAFDKNTPQIYKENINGKTADKLSGVSGNLLQSIFY